ncbi:MAG: hypothetical protein M0Q13_13420, partial [Methanothrix sp.]|nr:hypothetical protein [Methanothrix sp.]
MQKPDSKCKNETRFKRKYRDVFLVFAVLMITGVLLAISALAQADDFNQQPTLTSLESDKSSPQEAGSSIKWTANAEDPENDLMSFIFRLKGPSTRDVWKPVNSDPSDNTWKWDTNSEDAGNYQISVSVSDETHAGPQFTPDEKIVYFTLTAPQAPAETQAEPTVEPLPVLTAPEQTYVPPAEEQQSASQEQVTQEQVTQPQETKPANLAPVMTSLTPFPASPQEAGITVTWEAVAGDQESDGLQFLFLLDDQPVTDWQYQNQWTWATSANEIGAHSVEARVRDGAHNKDGDSSQIASYIINKPNEKPVISDLSADKASPQETGSTVTWTAQ